MTTVALVAQPTTPPADPGGRGEDFGKSTPVGLVVLIVFFVAVFFLVRSMNKHLRRVPASFDPPPAETQPAEPSPAEPSPAETQPAEPSPADQAETGDGKRD